MRGREKAPEHTPGAIDSGVRLKETPGGDQARCRSRRGDPCCGRDTPTVVRGSRVGRIDYVRRRTPGMVGECSSGMDHPGLLERSLVRVSRVSGRRRQNRAEFEFHGPRPGEPSECLGRFILAGFPADAVAFAVQPYGRRISVCIPACLEPPIALADLLHGGTEGGPVKVRFSAACPGRENPFPTHVVRVWVGRGASAGSRELVERVLASFRYLRGPSDAE
jgi:hypothetical protein